MTAATAATLVRPDTDVRPDAGVGGPPRRSRVPATASQYLLWGAGLVVIVGPIVPVVWASLWSTPLYESGGGLTLANYRDLLTDADWWDAVRNSVTFALLTTAGSLIWNTIFVLAGFYLGENWHVAEQYAGIFSRIVVVTVAVLIAWWVLKRVLRNRRGLSDSARRERGQQ